MSFYPYFFQLNPSSTEVPPWSIPPPNKHPPKTTLHFGLARLFDHGTDPQTTHVVGTMGYLAPELVRIRKATTVTDVYAFRAFLLEVACGRRSVDLSMGVEEHMLVSWVLKCWQRGVILEVRDYRLEEYNNSFQFELELVLKLGLLCSNLMPAARPSMRQVVQYIEGDLMLPDLPKSFLSYGVVLQTGFILI